VGRLGEDDKLFLEKLEKELKRTRKEMEKEGVVEEKHAIGKLKEEMKKARKEESEEEKHVLKKLKKKLEESR